MTKYKQLVEALKHEKNNPIQSMDMRLVKYFGEKLEKINGELEWVYVDTYTSIAHFINIDYCCLDGKDLKRMKTSYKKREQELMDSITTHVAVLIRNIAPDSDSLRMQFKREFHWINQSWGRQKNFGKIFLMLDNKINEMIEGIDINKYLRKHADELSEMLPMKPRTLYLQSLSKDTLLEMYERKELTKEEFKELLNFIPEEKEDLNTKLCQFSGSGSNADTPTRTCTNPAKFSCSSCRVAAEWEECYG